MISLAVIGYGYWGPNLVRNFMQVDHAHIRAVCDASAERRAAAEKIYPGVITLADPTDVFADPEIDAVVIATPVGSHFELGMRALEAGKHVLIEKPIASSVAEAEALVAEADRRGLVLMVDHTFIYTSAVRKMHELVESGELGELYYYDSVRVNLGLFQSDVSVIWDLAVHDLSIMDRLFGASPCRVSATGMAHVPGEPVNIAYLTCSFVDTRIAHFHVNWLAPVKVRQTMLCGSEKMVVFDDIDMSEKVKVYDKGVVMSSSPQNTLQRHVGYRTGDMWAPRLDNVEALAVEAEHFVDCIINSKTPITDGHAGLRIVRILEAASASLGSNGAPVEL